MLLDTSVLVAGFRSYTGASRRLLDAVLDRKLTTVASVSLFLEYEATLTRSEHLKASGLSAAEVNDVLDALAEVVRPVSIRFTGRPLLSDPGDEMVLEAAINGGANCIVTFNQRDFVPAAERFGIQVVAPGSLWRQINKEVK